ncbi:MAG: Cof-type HAD-IIB family hydrolase [Firmicutes bacterium]|nr:Cof-type HAD-IIB family hydrolase [Bacillota bacterium]
MAEIRAVITDLDDTLLNERHQMTGRTVATLKRLTAQGIKVILASGRSAASIRPQMAKAGTPWPYIAFNGAQILDAGTHLILSASQVPMELARQVLLWFEARQVYAQYYDGDDWYYETPSQITEDYAKSSGIAGTRTAGRLSESIVRPTPKVLAVAAPDRVPGLMAEAAKAFGNSVAVTTSKPCFVEITMPDATKGHAVRKLAAMLNLSPETTLCAGDSLNDLSMLAWSKLPVSVANAREEVKAVAWRVAGHGHKDGLAELLDELIPSKA